MAKKPVAEKIKAARGMNIQIHILGCFQYRQRIVHCERAVSVEIGHAPLTQQQYHVSVYDSGTMSTSTMNKRYCNKNVFI